MFGPTKTSLIRAGEALAAIGAVLLFFLCFMAIIGLIFPKGTALGVLVLSDSGEDAQTAARLDMHLTGAESFIAVLSQANRSVKNKRANAIAWTDAHSGMSLGERHSVQTLDRSGAVISFDGDDRLVLDENSLVVIRSMTRLARQQRRRTSVVALEGRLRGRIEPGDPQADDLEIEVVTASGTTRVQADTNRDADFDVSVNPDDTSTFTIRRGKAVVTSAGQSVTLRPNQTITVARSKPPGRPVSLPSPAVPITPRDGTAMGFRSVAPSVPFEWSGETGTYRLEIGRDPEFQEIVYEEKIQDSKFVHGNLPAGRLFWRVTALDGWAEASPGQPRSLELVQDTLAPGLEVSFPQGRVPVTGALLHGITEPGTRLFVSDHDVPLGDAGSFEFALNLEPGINLVVVEAIDPAGNVTYRSKLIEAEQESSSR